MRGRKFILEILGKPLRGAENGGISDVDLHFDLPIVPVARGMAA
jgi:hypothetical protein